MIWLTWRQHRRQLFYTALALLAVAAVMLPTGLAMHHTFTDTGLAACLASVGTAQVVSGNGPDCSQLSDSFGNQYSSMTFIGVLFVILPVFLGIFLGAPLVAREVEHGTHRLVWTQGITRRRWALVKIGLLGGVTILLAAAYALGMTWWFTPLVTNGGGRLGPISFDVQGIAPIAYTLFAVALGVYAGTVFKKVMPAMGVTLAGYALVRGLIEGLARSHYLSPAGASVPVIGTEQFNTYSGAWVYSEGIVNASGKLVQANGRMSCGDGGARVAGGAPIAPDCGGDLLSKGLGPAPFSNWMQYQPADRFWAFQGIESGIFLGLTVILIVLAVRRVRRIV
jgi:ABC-type transport system involved in multi-copper enzyme maturation permease subunit